MKLAGRVVLVTGASRGIGRATAELLADQGAILVCTGRDEAELRAVSDLVGGSYVVADLAEVEAAERVVSHAITTHGRLDVLVANAGIGYVGPFATMPCDELVRLIDLDLRAPLLLAQAAVHAMAQNEPADGRGAVVFLSSIAGAVGVPQESAYSACKAAIEAFADLLREEVAAQGISVSTVLPGVVDTDFLAARNVAYDRRFPRPMKAERVARAVVSVIETGRRRRIVPRWLRIPAQFVQLSPSLYRRLARRFG